MDKIMQLATMISLYNYYSQFHRPWHKQLHEQIHSTAVAVRPYSKHD